MRLDARGVGISNPHDGLVATREIHPKIAVIVVSGYAPHLVERLERLEPPPAFFDKPYRTRDIIVAMRRMTA